MSADNAAWHAALETLESRLLASWISGPAFRERWTPDPSDFSSPRARAVAEACVALKNRGFSAPDPGVLLVGELSRSGALRRHWTVGHSPLPVDSFPDPDARLREWSAMRTTFALHQRLVEELSRWCPGTDPSEARKRVLGLLESAYVNGPMRAYSDGELMALAIQVGTRPRAAGVFAGISDLDRVTGGIRPGHVWAIGAPTNWGKSSLLLALLDHNLAVHGSRSLLVTCEDDPEVFAARLLARRANLSGMDVRDGRLAGDELDRATLALKTALERGPAPVLLDGRGQSVESIASQIKILVARHQCHLVMVDYLQCIRSDAKRDNRRDEINHIARTLTDAIKTSGAGGVLASQLTGEDLRESRDVEHAAEVVLIGRRDEKTNALSLFVKKNKTGPAQGSMGVELDQKTGALLSTERPTDEYGIQDYEPPARWVPYSDDE